MNLPDSIQYKSHSVHGLFEPMHGYILSITFGNAIDFHSMGLVNRKKEEGVSKLTPPSLRDTSPKNFSNFQRRNYQVY